MTTKGFLHDSEPNAAHNLSSMFIHAKVNLSLLS